MISVTRLNGKGFVLNCELIRTIESVPDTVITLTDSEKLLVLETVDELRERIEAYRRRVSRGFREGERC